jgi:hypothetical protein
MRDLRILLFAIGLAVTVTSSRAGLGSTYAETVQVYGQPVKKIPSSSEFELYSFTVKGDEIIADFVHGRMAGITYNENENALSESAVDQILSDNCPNVMWVAGLNIADGTKHWTGTVNGTNAYYCNLSGDRTHLSIYTQELLDIVGAFIKTRLLGTPPE